jgi:chromosome segregation protein
LQAAELGTQLKSKQQALYQMRKTLEINEVQYSSLKMELEKESVESTEKTASLEEFEVRLQAVTLELSQKTEAYSAMLAKQQELEQQIMSGETAVKALEEQLSKSARVLDARQNEFNLTRSMLENLEGYPQAIRFIKKSTPWGKDAPLFSDIITCDEKYRVAIENFLEPWLNFFVLQNESQAFEAVNLLSDAAKGKGNFLLLDSFEQYQPQAFRQYEDALPALQVVEYDERYRYLVHAMLDGVYIVVKNQEQLPADDQVTFITQNGKVIRKKNTISGGSVGLFEGKKLGRIKNLEKLTVEIRELQQKNKQLEKVIQQKKSDLQYLKEELPGPQLQTLQQALARVQQDHVALKTRKEQFEEMLLAKENKQELMQEKIAQLAESITQLRPKVSEEVDALDELENRQADLADEAEQQSALLATRSAAFNQLNIQFHQQTNRLESIEKEMGYKESSYERVRARIENSQFELKNTETEILQLRESSGQHEQQLVDLYEEKERIESAVREAEKAYYQSRGQIGELEKQARELQKNREQVDQWLMECREQVNQIRMGMAATKERMLVEFETDLEALIAEDREDPFGFTEEYLREEVQKIKGKMEKMGAINHMAIEAYKEIEERHNFILAQRKDLLEAIASLHTTIGEIDTVAKENFLEAFTKIRENFIEVFRSLFTADDRCDLILLNPDDPLESKIEITAQPKGKRPLTINQLSGGEKTLTATALLFAIYLLKPAPFCIFDEVDAPLDDANIDKFNQIIKKFSANSQFIIVTHNKRTMASTDVMYGITMIEQGVSTVVPVDLREMQ